MRVKGQKIKNLIARIGIAQRAYDRYNKGILSDLEKHLGCNSVTLSCSWKITLDEHLAEYKLLTGENYKF